MIDRLDPLTDAERCVTVSQRRYDSALGASEAAQADSHSSPDTLARLNHEVHACAWDLSAHYVRLNALQEPV